MVDIHQEGHSQRSAPQRRHTAHLRRCSHCTPGKPSGQDRGGDEMHRPTWGEWAHQAPSCLSCLDLGRAQNAGPTESAPLGVLRNLNLSGLDLGSARNPGPALDSSLQSNLSLSSVDWESTHVGSGGKPSVAQTLWALPTHASDMFAVFLPPRSTTEQVSLSKGQPSPPCVRAEVRHWRDLQREKAKINKEGTALKVTGATD